MKAFKVIVPTVIVASFTIGAKEFDGKYDGCPSRLEKFIKETMPEYAKCATSWTWTENCTVFKMDFIASGDAIIEDVTSK